jgi:hypothetical protein
LVGCPTPYLFVDIIIAKYKAQNNRHNSQNIRHKTIKNIQGTKCIKFLKAYYNEEKNYT